ncbi:MAG: methyltransferase domain-containing protein [Candidatus Eisenbacteria bacterium]|nr:methyltransferase domain-containing protein [Candidatus Eisenbacteria bacterium]
MLDAPSQSLLPATFDTLIQIFGASRALGRPWPDPCPPFPASAIRLVDLRPREDFERAHIPGSCRLGLDEIDQPALRPPRRRMLLLLGSDASQTADGARRLQLLGYTARPILAPLSNWPGPWAAGTEVSPAWEPSRLAALWKSRLPVGPVLDLASGSGRTAVFLAMHGAEVTAIDLLPDAIAQASLLAKRHQVTIGLRQGDVEGNPSCWDGRWGTIHVHRFLDRGGFALLRDRLLPDGLLLYETFIEHQFRAGRKPTHPSHLLKSGELLQAARGMEVIDYREGETEEGDWTASLVARN